jgi:hypothetical protein
MVFLFKNKIEVGRPPKGFVLHLHERDCLQATYVHAIRFKMLRMWRLFI